MNHLNSEIKEGTTDFQEGALIPISQVTRANELRRKGLSFHFCKHLTFVRIPFPNQEFFDMEDFKEFGELAYFDFGEPNFVRFVIRGTRTESKI